MNGRHRASQPPSRYRPAGSLHGDLRDFRRGSHRKQTGIMMSALEITLMIMLGTLGVLMVLASRPFRGGTR